MIKYIDNLLFKKPTQHQKNIDIIEKNIHNLVFLLGDINIDVLPLYIANNRNKFPEYYNRQDMILRSVHFIKKYRINTFYYKNSLIECNIKQADGQVIYKKTKEYFLLFPFKKSLSCMNEEQSEEIVKEINRLGINN